MIDMSTISRADIGSGRRRVRARSGSRSCGRPSRAIESSCVAGNLGIIVSGPCAEFARLPRPLKDIGPNLFYVGAANSSDRQLARADDRVQRAHRRAASGRARSAQRAGRDPRPRGQLAYRLSPCRCPLVAQSPADVLVGRRVRGLGGEVRAGETRIAARVYPVTRRRSRPSCKTCTRTNGDRVCSQLGHAVQ